MANGSDNISEILTAHRFYLELKLDGQRDADAFFLECQGFKRTQNVIEVTQVTSQKWGATGQNKGMVVTTKIPGNVKSGNLTLRRGMINSTDFWKWFEDVQNGQWSNKRKLLSLSIYSQGNEELARFELEGAWPCGYKIADVNARSSEIEIEELEVAFEEFKRVK
ncbi:phage tail protein [Anabaena subtropica]|uniref:Phage tail protein n=1 Tax=Anabaena subtropica FACHB-260 TaxID=2692884 RepID=A0ABR8CLN5_9NOST|nr:phage tail protein [Anabaena subtropica]MBD2343804.1 phage tail protein [Anabaena subtropica FACHB-260]